MFDLGFNHTRTGLDKRSHAGLGGISCILANVQNYGRIIIRLKIGMTYSGFAWSAPKRVTTLIRTVMLRVTDPASMLAEVILVVRL